MAEPASSCTLSGSAPPSITTSNILSKTLKRRASAISDYDFFAPAASSFQPRPYTPQSNTSDNRIKPFQFTRSQTRTHESLVVPAGMDPHPSDPNVIFIHPPFNVFPNSDQHPDGLNYQLMAENPEWFLDPKDFVHENNANPHAIPYPPGLEPPRGWCPAKKKDLKERGAEGWPEGEEPRLRCTFCRRTYAGVNAKSMWRRHVFEKHKIAMANRRDGADRPRGRSSNKENKQISNKTQETHDTVVNLKLENAPGTESQNVSHRSKFRSTMNVDSSASRQEHQQSKDKSTCSTATLVSDPATDTPVTHHNPDSLSVSPPLTPHSSSEAGNTSIESSGGIPPTPQSNTPLVPPSPYDPLLTPSFRHSPPRLPSDQPWRFPSPSHPLHSQSRDMSLSMLVRNMASPLVKGSPILGGSPLIYGPEPSSGARFIRPETPLNNFKFPLTASHTRLTRSRLASSPLTSRSELSHVRRRVEESPLSRAPQQHKRKFSDLTDDWLSEASVLSTQLGDPFKSIFASGGRVETTSPMKRVLEAESPVLRNRVSTVESRGLGIGLLEPFDLNRPTASDDEVDNFDSSSVAEELDNVDMKDEAKDVQSQQTSSLPPPPSKRMRFSMDD